jgi:hypothetical protein
MCIIIDKNMAGEIFANPKDQDSAPVIEWLHDGKSYGCLAIGGRVRRELFDVGEARRTILGLMRAGRIYELDDADVDSEEQSLINRDVCQSDDPHVIALARLSRARTLCSHDQDLHEDFKNPALINNPRGVIYQVRDHSKLLGYTCPCRATRCHHS